MTRNAWWPVLLLSLSGCMLTSGFNRDLLESRLREGAGQITDKDVQEIQTLKPQLRFPCRIAVALKGERCDGRWTAKDREVMESWAGALRQEGIATDVVFMSALFIGGETLKELRASAARYGADALLVIRGAAVTDSRMNPLALFNLTVVGGFVVPGSRRDALFLIEGGLVDVNNGFLYAAMEADGAGITLAPSFVIEEKDAIDKAKQAALKAFGPELLQRLRNLRASGLALAR